MKLLCWLGWHHFTHYSLNKKAEDRVGIEMRICKRCELIERKQIAMPSDVELHIERDEK